MLLERIDGGMDGLDGLVVYLVCRLVDFHD